MNELEDLDSDDFADSKDLDGTPEPYQAEASTSPVNVTTFANEYDYDVETSINSFFWDELLPTLFVYSLTFILGLIGNILIIFTTFRYRKMKSTTNVFLASLASADLLLIVFCIPVKEHSKRGFRDHAVKFRKQSPKNPRSPKSRHISLRDLRELLDKLIEEKNFLEEHKKKRRGYELKEKRSAGDYKSPRFVPDKSENSGLEYLMLDLSNSLRNCKEFFKPDCSSCFEEIHQLRETDKEESIKCNNVIAYPMPELRLVDAKCCKRIRKEEKAEQKARKKRDKKEYKMVKKCTKLRDKYTSSSESSICTIITGSTTRSERRDPCLAPPLCTVCSPSPPCNLPTAVTTPCPKKKVCKCKKCREILLPSQCEHLGLALELRAMEKKIVKLDNNLKEMMRRIAVYPPKDQNSIKCCLEKLKDTSEALLSKIRLKREDDRMIRKLRKDCVTQCDRGYRSEPESALKIDKDKKSIVIRSSKSEVELNVGMEIVMENYDPVTGKKLRPEVNRNFEQEGNIQCRLLKDGHEPITFLSSDFYYNPKTGMLFKGSKPTRLCKRPHGTHAHGSARRAKSPEHRELLFPGCRTLKLDRDSEIIEMFKRDDENFNDAFGNVQVRERSTSPETMKTVKTDAYRVAIAREEVKSNKLLEDRSSSASGHGDTTAKEQRPSSSKRESHRRISMIPTPKHSQRTGVANYMNNQQGSIKYSEKKMPSFLSCSDDNLQDFHDRWTGSEVFTRDQCTVTTGDKCTQTNPGSNKIHEPEDWSKRSTGMQADLKGKTKLLVNQSVCTDSHGAISPLNPKGVNVTVQTVSVGENVWRRNSTDFQAQVNFDQMENHKFLKELETQKRVNLAIAELCFHLTANSDTPF